MNTDIEVSINCITYNHEKYIEKAIESFLNQKTNFKYEILIHDDASEDRTSEIIKKYKKKYPDIIKIIIQKENQYSKGIKVGLLNLEKALGKYIAVCEGDDYWCDEKKLQKQYDYLNQNNQCSMVFSNSYYLDDLKNEIINKTNIENKKYYIKDVILNGGGFIPSASIMYRKTNMEKIPQFYLNAAITDYPLQMIAALKGYLYCFNDYMSVYRINNSNSWTNNQIKDSFNPKKDIENKKKIINILNDFDEFTDFFYKEITNEARLPFEYSVFTLENNLSLNEMKNSEFSEYYFKIIKNKSLKIKFLINLRIISTKNYIRYKKIMNFFKFI